MYFFTNTNKKEANLLCSFSNNYHKTTPVANPSYPLLPTVCIAVEDSCDSDEEHHSLDVRITARSVYYLSLANSPIITVPFQDNLSAHFKEEIHVSFGAIPGFAAFPASPYNCASVAYI